MKMIKYKNEIREVEFRIDQRGYKTSEIIGIIRHYSPISDRLIFSVCSYNESASISGLISLLLK